MPKIPYNKPRISSAQELQKLKDLGLIVDDETLALHKLQHYNYYRLAAYWIPFQLNSESREFRPGTTFDDILRVYNLDRRLRLIVLDAIERIEVSVRAQWANKLTDMHGTHAHLDNTIVKDVSRWNDNKSLLTREVDRSEDFFITHFKRKYSDELPPITVVCEVISLGLLSKWYSNLKPLRTRRAIADVYELGESVLESWLHHLTIIRNISAHHSRLWNKNFGHVMPRHTRKKPKKLTGEFTTNPHIYNSLLILLHMLDVLEVGVQWRKRLVELLIEHEDCLPKMGFPEGWKNKEIWRTT